MEVDWGSNVGQTWRLLIILVALGYSRPSHVADGQQLLGGSI